MSCWGNTSHLDDPIRTSRVLKSVMCSSAVLTPRILYPQLHIEGVAWRSWKGSSNDRSQAQLIFGSCSTSMSMDGGIGADEVICGLFWGWTGRFRPISECLFFQLIVPQTRCLHHSKVLDVALWFRTFVEIEVEFENSQKRLQSSSQMDGNTIEGPPCPQCNPVGTNTCAA